MRIAGEAVPLPHSLAGFPFHRNTPETVQMAKAPTDLRSLARQHTQTAVRTLAGIMRAADAPPAARVAASQALLDRGWGKAPQTLHVTDQPLDPTSISDGELVAIATGGCAGTLAQEDDQAKLH